MNKISHKVKCKVCGITFDRDREEAVPVGGRRYAHAKCANNYEPSKEETDLATLHTYLQDLFKNEYNYVVLQKQIEKFVQEYHYSYSGIFKTLVYWYNVKENSLEKANNRIGIVPHVYQEARNYYLAQFLAQQKNQDKDLQKYKNPEIREIRIKTPERDPLQHRLFNLDD